MKGLLIKDLRLSLQRRQTLLIFLIVSLVMSLSLEGSFVITYMVMLLGITAVGTISYDEFDNGFPFLFSLPIDCRSYVREKFLFCFLMELLGLVYGIAVMFISSFITGRTVDTADLPLQLLIIICTMSVMFAVMLCIQLKYGSEKSRTVMMVIYGLIAVLSIFLKSKIGYLQPWLSSVWKLVSAIRPWMFMAGFVALSLLICFLLYLLGVRIMEKKEF